MNRSNYGNSNQDMTSVGDKSMNRSISSYRSMKSGTSMGNMTSRQNTSKFQRKNSVKRGKKVAPKMGTTKQKKDTSQVAVPNLENQNLTSR